MRVKITHTLELDEVPTRVNELVQPAKDELEKCIDHLQSVNHLLSSSVDSASISLATLHIDAIRRKLAVLDNRLEEAYMMIKGVSDFNEQQELSSQFAAEEEQLSSPQSSTEPQTDSPKRKWNPHTRMLEEYEEEVDDDKSL